MLWNVDFSKIVNFMNCYSLSGVSEKVADIKTRAHAMKCLTAFCEAVGPGFVFDRVRDNCTIYIFFCSKGYVHFELNQFSEVIH